MAGDQVGTLSPFYSENYFSSLLIGLLFSILALNTEARVILIKHKVDHVTPLLKTLRK